MITRRAPDLFGALVCTGVVCWFGFQAFENIGMTVGLIRHQDAPIDPEFGELLRLADEAN